MGAVTERRRVTSVFDVNRFLYDVDEYRYRNGLSRRELVASADLDLSTTLGILRRTNRLSLMAAVALADVCDLSLDDYRRGLFATP